MAKQIVNRMKAIQKAVMPERTTPKIVVCWHGEACDCLTDLQAGDYVIRYEDDTRPLPPGVIEVRIGADLSAL